MSSDTIDKGKTLTLRVDGFSNPLFSRPIEGFQIRTLDTDGGLIEESLEFEIAV